MQVLGDEQALQFGPHVIVISQFVPEKPDAQLEQLEALKQVPGLQLAPQENAESQFGP